jgi:antitoxin (DNA-binding transcriptional repressor) of toxin-antitoxin stability system
MIVNVSEAKTNLSKLIDMAYHGEEVNPQQELQE